MPSNADILGKMGRKLYYYHKDNGVELDFLMRYKGMCDAMFSSSMLCLRVSIFGLK